MAKSRGAVHRSAPFLLLLCACAACASAAVERLYVAPSHENILTYFEASPTSNAQILIVENESSEAIYLTGVSLRNCENIRNTCGTTIMRRLIKPREKVRVMTIQALNENDRTNFSIGTSWEAAVSIPIIP